MKSNGLRAGVAIFMLSFGIACGSMLAAQSGGEPPPGRSGPSPAMIKACQAKSQGNACSTSLPDGRQVAGTCEAPAGRPLACRPKGRPPGMQAQGGPPPGNDGGTSGEPVADSEGDTDDVLFAPTSERQNAKLEPDGVAQRRCGACHGGLNAIATPAQHVNFSALTRPLFLSGPRSAFITSPPRRFRPFSAA
jgi:hypothetical protein